LDRRIVLAFPSDSHSGSSLGLMPPKQFALKDGGFYDPTPIQKLIWKQWEYGWNLIAEERKKSDLIVVHCGDLVEGIHHESTQIVSPRVDDHETISSICMDKAFRIVKMGANDKYYQISGTEEHAGNGSSSEERVAKDLDHVVPQWTQKVFDEEGEHINGRFTWNRLYREINGVVFDVSHHGGSVGQRAWTTENSLYNKIKSIYWSCLENNLPLPRYWIRGHNHQYIRAEYGGRRGIITGIMLPGFQARTGYCYKKINYDPKQADIGVVWIVVEKDGKSNDYVDKIEVRQEELVEF